MTKYIILRSAGDVYKIFKAYINDTIKDSRSKSYLIETFNKYDPYCLNLITYEFENLSDIDTKESYFIEAQEIF